MEKWIAVTGMSCGSCERKIEKKLNALDGVTNVTASYATGKVRITYDEAKVTPANLEQAISAIGYEISKGRENPFSRLAFVALVLLGAVLLLQQFHLLAFFNNFPEAKQGMQASAIFFIGLLTSLHCVGMCGGISLSQCVGSTDKIESKTSRLRPGLLYNGGRILSYTGIGAIIGAIGSVISLNGFMRGAVALLAGVLMVGMGLTMLRVFPRLRIFSRLRVFSRLRLRLSGFSSFFTETSGVKGLRPLVIGLLNGFMPCGPLQAMQLYALSTGSPVKAALSMFLFAIGTTPVMFGFGAVSSLLSKRLTAKMMAVSAVLVIFLGIGMFNTGMSMAGLTPIGTEKSTNEGFVPVIENGYQIVEVEVSSRSYGVFQVKKDIPVRLNLHAEQENLNGCNYAVLIPSYGLELVLSPGDNFVEFMPTQTGVVPYSCWMNMIRSSIHVVE